MATRSRWPVSPADPNLVYLGVSGGRGAPADFRFFRSRDGGATWQQLEEHNFSLSVQQVDKDIAPAATADVAVMFPSSGVLRFFCKYHVALGMNGQFLAGDATPQPV